MPRYFFDISDVEGVNRDEVGTCLPDRSTADAEALRALGDMVREQLIFHQQADIRINIRNEHGQTLVLYSLLLQQEPGLAS